MLADFYIPRLLNDMKLAVHQNHLGGQIFKKRRQLFLYQYIFTLKAARYR